MGWKVVDSTGENRDFERVVFHTEQAARSHAKFMNEREERNGQPT